MKAAVVRLKRFAFLDVIENPEMPTNLQAWLRQPVLYSLMNETARIPPSLTGPLHNEITSETVILIETRGRLETMDARTNHRRNSGRGTTTRCLAHVARHAWLMAA